MTVSGCSVISEVVLWEVTEIVDLYLKKKMNARTTEIYLAVIASCQHSLVRK